MVRWVLVMLLMACTVLLPGAPTSPTLTPAVQRLFRIGYLQREGSGHIQERHLEVLRRELMADAALVADLRADGYSRIGLFACDSPADMLRRLNALEFDLAFSPANLYDEQTPGYVPILKARRPGDRSDPRFNFVSRQGVVFASARNPRLFQHAELDGAALVEELAGERLAVVTTQSVAGFHAPLLELVERHGNRVLASGYLYFADSDEVVKGVLAGLANVGACEEAAIGRVLEQYGLTERRDELLTVLLETRPVVTDPVLLRPRLSPRFSSLGRRLRASIRTLAREGKLGDTGYEETSDEEYRKLSELLRAFREKVDVGER